MTAAEMSTADTTRLGYGGVTKTLAPLEAFMNQNIIKYQNNRIL